MHFIAEFAVSLFEFLFLDALDRKGKLSTLGQTILWILGIGALIGVMYLITLVIPESPFR